MVDNLRHWQTSHTTPIELILCRIPSRSKLKESGNYPIMSSGWNFVEDELIISYIHRPLLCIQFATHSVDAILQTLRGDFVVVFARTNRLAIRRRCPSFFFLAEKRPKPRRILIVCGRRDVVGGESVRIVVRQFRGFYLGQIGGIHHIQRQQCV